MFMYRYFSPRYPPLLLTAKPGLLVAAIVALLLIFGCGEENIDNPLSGSVNEDGKTEKVVSISTPYYPMTLGNRWVYRNPDGSEWTREVAESQNFGTELYHSFSYQPPIEDNQFDSLGFAEYLAYSDRLDRKINLKDIDDVVWQIILESGGGTPNWALGMTCGKDGDREAVCVSKKDSSQPGILTYLFHSNTSVVWHSKLTPLQFPLVPGDAYQSLNFRLKGKHNTPFYFHAYEAEGVISGKISDAPELVETSVDAFEDCLKIQYEASLTSYKTLEFKDVGVIAMIAPDEYLKTVESDTRAELTNLLTHIKPRLGLQTMWLAPGVGPVKIETPNGIAELIDYEVKAVASGQ